MATAAQLRSDHDIGVIHIKLVTGAYGSADIITSGQVVSASSLPVVIASDQSTLPVVSKPATSGGITTTFRLNAAGSTNDTLIKGSAGNVYALYMHNNAATARSVKLYNKATQPTVGTDTPVATYRLAATSVTQPSFGGTIGVSFSLGIGIGITLNSGDSDTTAVTAGDVYVDLSYA